MTSANVIAALRERYSPPAYAFLEEVANGTGGYNSNRADALVMSLWPSRGLTLYGFEVKVSRQDWKRELERPSKAEAIAKYCDAWFVAAPKGLIPSGDVPAAWGLIEVDDKLRTRIVKDVQLPSEIKPVSRAFLAAIFRKVHDTAEALTRDHVHRDQVAEASKELIAERTNRLKYQLESCHKELGDLRERVRAFEDASGIPMSGWTQPKAYGETVRVLTERREGWQRCVHSAAESLERSVEQMRTALAGLREAELSNEPNSNEESVA